MKYCKHCGAELLDSDAYCLKCGNKVEETEIKVVMENQTNGMSVAGFILAFFIPLLGWIFGGVGLKRAKGLNGKGYGLSIAAIIIATVNYILAMVLYFNR